MPTKILLLVAAFTVSRIAQTTAVEPPIITPAPAAESTLRPDQNGDKPNVAAIDAAMRDLIDRGEMIGAVTFVVDRDRWLHLGAVGSATLDPKTSLPSKPMTNDTVFAIASMTKPITAVAMMKLLQRGSIKMSDPVSQYLPEFEGITLADGSTPSQPITIANLMTHTSGVDGPHWVNGSITETVTSIASRPLKFHPGSRWQYSPGLTVCGRIIEVVDGRSFQTFLRDEIFDPLGMSDTRFYPTESMCDRIATIVRPAKQPSEPSGGPRFEIARNVHAATGMCDSIDAKSDDVRGPSPSAGLYSTAKDLAKFYQALLDDRLLTRSTLSTMTTNHTGELKAGFTAGCGWGYGVCVVRDPVGVTSMLSPGTFGHGGAFGTQGWIDPVRGRIYGLLIQRTGMPGGDASIIRQQFQQLASELP